MMLRHLTSRLVASHQVRQVVHQYYSQRHFTSEIVATWPEGIKKFLEREQINEPTSIQKKTLSIAMENKNLVGVARTGSGKTLAFVIPAVVKILEERKNESQPSEQSSNLEAKQDEFFSFRDRVTSKPPKCLVLAPTRELAGQINDVFEKFRHMQINSIPLVGGSSRNEQIKNLYRQSYDVYVATPGRLMDLVEAGIVDLSQIKYLVLDEADRMLDMGFEPQIRKIISQVPDKRQTLMWSATWPQEIQSLAAEFLHDYEYIAVDSEQLKANPNIKQIVDVCQPFRKLDRLLEHLRDFQQAVSQPRVLVFVNTKRLADTLIIQMMKNRIKAISMHGDRSQKQRDDALKLFKTRQCNVLIATDVAARGLDISDITHVVNYDFPNTIEDYIHRIGRTARHERSGTAITLFTENEANHAKKLVEVLKETAQEIPEPLKEFARNSHLYRNTTSKRMRPRRQDFYSSGGSFRSRNSGMSEFSDSRINNRHQSSFDDRFARLDGRGSRSRSQYDDEDFDDEFNDDDNKRSSGSSGRFRANSIFNE